MASTSTSSVKKTVSFNRVVVVVLVHTREELSPIFEDLYYSRESFLQMKMDAAVEMRNHLRGGGGKPVPLFLMNRSIINSVAKGVEQPPAVSTNKPSSTTTKSPLSPIPGMRKRVSLRRFAANKFGRRGSLSRDIVSQWFWRSSFLTRPHPQTLLSARNPRGSRGWVAFTPLSADGGGIFAARGPSWALSQNNTHTEHYTCMCLYSYVYVATIKFQVIGTLYILILLVFLWKWDLFMVIAGRL